MLTINNKWQVYITLGVILDYLGTLMYSKCNIFKEIDVSKDKNKNK